MKARLLLIVGILWVQPMLSCSHQSNPSDLHSSTANGESQHKVVQVDLHAELDRIQKDLKSNPQSAPLHNQAANVYDSLGDFQSFEREIQTAMTLDPENPIHPYIAYAVYKRRHATEKQTAVLDMALKIDPANPFGHYERASIFEDKKQWRDAFREYGVAQELIQHLKADARNLNSDRLMYVDTRGNPFDVTFQEMHIADDIARVRGVQGRN